MSLPTASSVVSSGLADYPTIYYDRVAQDTLIHNLFMYPACDLKIMPDRSGVAMQVYGFTALQANTTPATEGTPGAGEPLTQNVATINLANYVDYVSISNKVVLTALSDITKQGAELLAYQGALSVDTVTQNAVIAQANENSDVDIISASTLTAEVAREAVWGLRSLDVKPKANGLMFGITGSLTAFDLVNDATAGGFLDLQKFSESLATNNPALAGIKGARVGNVGGCEFYESNNVTVTSGSPDNTYNSYVFGHQAFWASSLGKTNLNQKNFSVTIREFPMGSNSLDPAGLIAAAAAYNFFYGLVAAPTAAGTDRFRIIQTGSTIG